MSKRKKKEIEAYECQTCKNVEEGQPRFALLRFPIVEFCSEDCMDKYIKGDQG